MFQTFKFLNKYTLDIVEFSIDLKVQMYPSYYIIISPATVRTDLGDCSICLNTINNDYHKTDCNHIFHRKCYEQWHSYNISCPLCRTENEYKKLDHLMNITYLEGNITIPVRKFKLKLNSTDLLFDNDDFIKLYNSSPCIWKKTFKPKEGKNILEPVYKLRNIYISYFLRNTILFSNNYEIKDIITCNQIYDDNMVLYIDCDNEIYNKGIISKNNVDIVYEWIFDVMHVITKEKQLEFPNMLNTEILNIMFTYLYYNEILRKDYQKLACVAMYLVHKKKVELEFFRFISDYTYSVEQLQEFTEIVEDNL